MRTVERLCLYLVVGFVVFSLLDRAGAEDEAEKGGAFTPASKPLTAEAIEIRNTKGDVVIRLGAAIGGGGQIEIFNAAGKAVTRLHARPDHDGELLLYDEDGQYRASLGGNDDGGYINIMNREGKNAAYIGNDADSNSGYMAIYGGGQKACELFANDKGGVLATNCTLTKKRTAMIGSAPNDGSGIVAVGNPEGQRGIVHFVTKHGGQISVFNAEDKAAAFLGVSASPAGNGLIYVARKDGMRLMEAGAGATRGGYLGVRNALNQRVIFIGASSGSGPDDGVVEVQRRDGTLGVVLRAEQGASSVRLYDDKGKVIRQIR